jgi:uncharacterized protein YndB with AHSA1/START domain
VSTVTRDVAASPEQVWAVLADGWSYAGWVVGASRMRDVEDDWPVAGSRLHHSVGVWPLLINDSTSVLESEPGRRIVLQARAWPAGEATVELQLDPVDVPGVPRGCRVTMSEAPTRGPGRALHNPVNELLLTKRNVESLLRLARLAEGRT